MRYVYRNGEIVPKTAAQLHRRYPRPVRDP